MRDARELGPNIHPNTEPSTQRKDTHNMDTNEQYLPPTPGEIALAEAMARAPNLAPVDTAAAERIYVANVTWATDHAEVFSNAGLSMEVVAGGVRVRCRSCDRMWTIQSGVELSPAVLACPRKCNAASADPDFGMARTGVAP